MGPYLLSCLFLGPLSQLATRTVLRCRNIQSPRLELCAVAERWAWGREVPLDCCVAPLPWRPQPPRRTARLGNVARPVLGRSLAASLDVASSPLLSRTHYSATSLLPFKLTSSLFTEPLRLGFTLTCRQVKCQSRPMTYRKLATSTIIYCVKIKR